MISNLKKHPVAIAVTVLATVAGLFMAVVELDDRYAKAKHLQEVQTDLESTFKSGLQQTDRNLKLVHLSTREQGLSTQQLLLEQQLESAESRGNEREVTRLTRRMTRLENELRSVKADKRILLQLSPATGLLEDAELALVRSAQEERQAAAEPTQATDLPAPASADPQ